MKTLFSFLLVFCLSVALYAGNLMRVSDAQLVSRNFVQASHPEQSPMLSDFTLIHTEMGELNEPAYYVFDFRDKGFVVVAANDAVSPVLAYSLNSKFSADVPNLFLSNYKKEIASKRTTKDAKAEKEWSYFLNYVPRRDETTCIGEEVPILLTSTWDQGQYYNTYTPVCNPGITNDYYADDNHCNTGCTALTMAALMHYYRYPEYGTGGISYQPPYIAPGQSSYLFPVQNQHFDVCHNYDMMPDNLDSYAGEVARLAWHCGISIEINYTPADSYGGMPEEVAAMRQFWGYNPAADFRANSNVADAQWLASLQNELDQRHPVITGGAMANLNAGHVFILDGYQNVYLIEDQMDSIEGTSWQDTIFSHVMLHANFGWGGYTNGYYLYSAGHLDGWSTSQSAIFNLYPNNQPAKETSGHRSLHSTEGTISDGAGNLLYQPNTDRSWMIFAPEATRYDFQFSRFELADSGDYVAFYPNGDMNNEAARATATEHSSVINIMADSVLVRFVTNDNDNVDYGFVCEYEAKTTPNECEYDQIISGEGMISFGGNGEYDGVTPYRPNTTCTWKANGCSQAYFYYPHLDLAPGDFIYFYDITSPGSPKLIKVIDEYNWPTDDVFSPQGGHKFRIKFVSDNYLENSGFEIGYTLLTDIHESNLSKNVTVYPNPAKDKLNIDVENAAGNTLQIRLCDLTGRAVWQETATSEETSFHHTISTSDFAPGIYLLHIVGEKNEAVKKVIVEK